MNSLRELIWERCEMDDYTTDEIMSFIDHKLPKEKRPKDCYLSCHQCTTLEHALEGGCRIGVRNLTIREIRKALK